MSLFENSSYRWRETYFVMLEKRHLPSKEKLCQLLTDCGFQLEDAQVAMDDPEEGEELAVESAPITVYSPEDSAAMDITWSGNCLIHGFNHQFLLGHNLF